MKPHKLLFFIVILPLTLVLDIILYAFLQSCPSCSTFSHFLAQETAFSFPAVVALTTGVAHLVKKFESRLPAQTGNPKLETNTKHH